MLMKRQLIPLLCMALLALSCTGKQETFTNPLLAGDYPDPSVMRDGDDYYMTHSSFEYQPGLTVLHSRDLIHWEPISYALHTYLGSVWAPDLCKVGDKYYIYFTVNPQRNFVVWADSPYGPWSDPIDLHVGQIDPGHLVDDEGQRWLFLSGGHRARLSDDGLSLVPGSLEKVYPGWPLPDDWIAEGMCLEGPKMKKIGRYYYYVSAEGGTAGPPTSHAVVVARSESVDGPWENSPYNPLVHTYDPADRWWSRGHGTLIDTPDGRWYVIYHSYENGFYSLGRQTLLEPVRLDDDGWFKPVKGLDVAAPMVLPLPPAPLPSAHDRLSEFRIGLEWRFFKEFNPSRATVENGVLTLQAEGSSPADAHPLLFIAGDHSYEVEVEAELSGEVTAGLVLMYDEDHFVGTAFNPHQRLSYRHAKRHRRAESDTDHLWLRLRNDGHLITYYYSEDGQNWHREPFGHDVSGYHHNTFHGFMSILPGVFAAGEGQAVFSKLTYRTL